MRMDELLDEIYQEESDLLKLEEEKELEEVLLRQENMVLQKIKQEQQKEKIFEKSEQKQDEKIMFGEPKHEQGEKRNVHKPQQGKNGEMPVEKSEENEDETQNYVVEFPAKKKTRKRINRKKIFIILAAAVMMFGTVVSASQYYDLDIRLQKMIGSSEVMKDLSGGFVQIGVSDTDKDVTVTATQAIGDKNSQWIILDTNIPWEAGKEGYYMFENFNILFYKKTQTPKPGGYSVESYNNNGFVSFFISAEIQNINRLSVCFSMDKILEYDSVEDDVEDGRMVSDGSWKLGWKNKYAANAKVSYPMKTVDFSTENGTNFSALIYKIEYSPLNIRVEMIKNPKKQVSTQLEDAEITSVTLKDGTVVPAQASQGGSYNNTFLYTSISFESMGKINLEEVKSITIGGEEIGLN